MKTKNEVYVEVRTEKQARKLKGVLDCFGIEWHCNQFGGNFNYFYFDDDLYSTKSKLTTTKVSIKELRNILASEHLKEGDVVIFKNGLKGKIVGFNGDSEIIVNDEDKDNVTCLIRDFIRYATEEEKALLEPKKELEIGKWYKHANGGIVNYQGGNSGYGISNYVSWYNNSYWCFDGYNAEATPEEVKQALIDEAKMRYNVGDRVKCLVDGVVYSVSEKKHPTGYHNDDNDYWMWDDSANRGICVFQNGKWAEVINTGKLKVEVDTAPIKEAFEKLGDAINDLIQHESPEQKVVKYAESVDWDFEKVRMFINYTVSPEEYEELTGEYSKEKTEHIFNKHNPHWELKKAHKEGADIQIKSIILDVWNDVFHPTWSTNRQYRITPLKPNDWIMYYSGDIKKYTIITESNLNHFSKRECTRVKDSKLIELLNNNK